MDGTDDRHDLVEFYDEWADDYDAAHADWRATVRVHGTLLAEALAARGITAGARVLDCTCGIGTQAIGLALAGYEVSGSDLSPREIDRARTEAESFGVAESTQFAVADLLALESTLPASWQAFDAVISANSLTHFADDDSLAAVFTQMRAMCRNGGVVVVTNRDYDAVADMRPVSTAVQQSVVGGMRRVSFQLWDWAANGRSYRMEDVLMTRPEAAVEGDDGLSVGPWTTRSRATILHAWRRADIERAAFVAGLTDVEWTQRGHQPVATFIAP
ncbi:MAG: Methyltransferase type 11 [Ilumatobacteraceae bacterium]|nr:Methyltransferase type 11 [Ilumatobacteraceae bacterium]